MPVLRQCEEDKQLGDKYSHEHRERIDSCIVDGSIVCTVLALCESENRRVGTSTADQTCDLIEVQVEDETTDYCDSQSRDDGDEGEPIHRCIQFSQDRTLQECYKISQ